MTSDGISAILKMANNKEKTMHEKQEKLLELSKKEDIGKMSYLKIGKLVGIKNAQTVKHHLLQLQKNGLIQMDKEEGVVERIKQGISRMSGLVAIPIVGSADCGPETKFADEYVQGYIRVSSSIVPYKKGMFAIQADGFSMNKAQIGFMKKNIEPGDYVIVDGSKKSPENGDYVLSAIDGLANIKRFYLDKENKQIVLMSESTKNYPPIHIGMDEIGSYIMNGQVIDVIKKPKI